MEREVLIPLVPKDDKHKLLYALSYIKELKLLLDKAELEIKEQRKETDRKYTEVFKLREELKELTDPHSRTKQDNQQFKKDKYIKQLLEQILKLQQESNRLRNDNRDLIYKLHKPQ